MQHKITDIEEMAKAVKIAHDEQKYLTSDRSINAIAKYLYNAGYRKASDVAREIFEEIEEMLNLQAKIVCETRGKYSETDEPLLSFIAMLDGRIYSLRVVEEHIAELKKKYTENKGE
jgi:hypothetical protein